MMVSGFFDRPVMLNVFSKGSRLVCRDRRSLCVSLIFSER